MLCSLKCYPSSPRSCSPVLFPRPVLLFFPPPNLSTPVPFLFSLLFSLFPLPSSLFSSLFPLSFCPRLKHVQALNYGVAPQRRPVVTLPQLSPTLFTRAIISDPPIPLDTPPPASPPPPPPPTRTCGCIPTLPRLASPSTGDPGSASGFLLTQLPRARLFKALRKFSRDPRSTPPFSPAPLLSNRFPQDSLEW